MNRDGMTFACLDRIVRETYGQGCSYILPYGELPKRVTIEHVAATMPLCRAIPQNKWPIPNVKPTNIDELLARFGPQCISDDVKWEARVGDALLTLALTLIEKELIPPRGKRRPDTTTPRSNAFLAGQITRDWPHLRNFKYIHDKGTAVECAIYRLYLAEGLPSVITLARGLVEAAQKCVPPPTYVY
jgi:hypothetical protein